MRKWLPIIVFFLPTLLWVSTSLATNYYLRADGTVLAANKANATGCGATTTAMNITQHNAATFAAGDTITLCDTGGVFTDGILTPPTSGSAGNVITYNASGSPVISGADVFNSWTTAAGTVPSPTVVCNNTGVTATSAACAGTIATAGDLLVVTAFLGTNETLTLADTKGNVWTTNSTTPVVTSGMYGSNNLFLTWYVPANNGSGSDTFTVSGGSQNMTIDVTEWTGGTVSPFDGKNTVKGGSSSQNLDSGASTGSSGNTADLVYGVCNGGNTMVLGTNISFATIHNWSFGGSHDLIEWAIGAGNSDATCSQGTASVWGAQVLTFVSAPTPTLYHESAAWTPNQVFYDGTVLAPVLSKGALATGKWWWDATNSYVWIYDNPSGHTINVSNRAYAINGNAKTYLTFSGLAVTMANSYGIYCLTGCSNWTLSGVSSQYSFIDGFFIQASTNLLLTGSTLAYNGNNGAWFTNISSSTISNNQVNYNGTNLPYASENSLISAGFYFQGGGNNDTVQSNTLHDNGRSLSTAVASTGYCPGVGIFSGAAGTGFVSQYNQVYNNECWGIIMYGTNGYSLKYNLVYGNSGGIQTATSNTTPNQNGVLYNNTVYANNWSGGQGYMNGIEMMGNQSTLGANLCLNNTMKNTLVTGQTLLGTSVVFLAGSGCSNDGTEGSGNVYLNNGYGPQTTNFLEWPGTEPYFGSHTYYSTYTLWEGATGNCGTTGCSHSVQTDPQFLNAAVGNFNLSATSPAIAAGTNVSLTMDFYGNAVIPGFVSLGAIQYQPKPFGGVM